MTSEPAKPDRPARPNQLQYDLAVSKYDQVSGVILSLIILVGLVVLGLVVILYTSRIFARPQPVPVTLENVAGRGENNLGLERDLEPLGAEDAPDLNEPQLQDALLAISDSVSDQEARLDDQAFDGDPQSSRGSGKGDNRAAGSGAEGIEEKVPRAQRWEIRFAGNTLEEYARQLDHFNIELAALNPAGTVDYASNLTQAKPTKKTKSPELEDRLYMTWRGGPLEAADRQLLTRSGIETQGRVLVQFFSSQTEALLALKEKEHAGKREINEIRKTIFGVRAIEGGYEFYVLDQRYF